MSVELWYEIRSKNDLNIGFIVNKESEQVYLRVTSVAALLGMPISTLWDRVQRKRKDYPTIAASVKRNKTRNKCALLSLESIEKLAELYNKPLFNVFTENGVLATIRKMANQTSESFPKPPPIAGRDLSIRDYCDHLRVPPQFASNLLQHAGVFEAGSLKPKQFWLDASFFRMVTVNLKHGQTTVPLITPLGQEFFLNLFLELKV